MATNARKDKDTYREAFGFAEEYIKAMEAVDPKAAAWLRERNAEMDARDAYDRAGEELIEVQFGARFLMFKRRDARSMGVYDAWDKQWQEHMRQRFGHK